MNFRELLSGRIHENQIHELVFLTQGRRNDTKKEMLYRLIFDADKRVADNAAWVFTHFDAENNEWLYRKHDELIDETMKTASETKLRLILSILLRQPFPEEGIRTDFLDFCLRNMPAADRPTGIRALCMKLAYRQCRWFPELLAELETALSIMEPEFLTAGLRSTLKNVLKELRSIA